MDVAQRVSVDDEQIGDFVFRDNRVLQLWFAYSGAKNIGDQMQAFATSNKNLTLFRGIPAGMTCCSFDCYYQNILPMTLAQQREVERPNASYLVAHVSPVARN